MAHATRPCYTSELGIFQCLTMQLRGFCNLYIAATCGRIEEFSESCAVLRAAIVENGGRFAMRIAFTFRVQQRGTCTNKKHAARL